MSWVCKPFRDLCQGQPCIACGRQCETVVPAHANEGKGMGMKVSDALTIPLCMSCHTAYDLTTDRDDARAWFNRLHAKWMCVLIEGGALVLSGKPLRFTLPKIVRRNF